MRIEDADHLHLPGYSSNAVIFTQRARAKTSSRLKTIIISMHIHVPGKSNRNGGALTGR